MPRPRFERLSPEKRERILATAAQEFAAYGYAQASLNRILETAGISKGAAYYYFDDKADVYMTAVQHYTQELAQTVELTPETLTAESFWPTMTASYARQFALYKERPWVLGLAKSGGLSPDMLTDGPLAAFWQSFWQEIQSVLRQLIAQGQALGVVRTDLPDDLLVALVVAVDDAHDRWLFGRMGALSDEELAAGAVQIGDLLRRLLEPGR